MASPRYDLELTLKDHLSYSYRLQRSLEVLGFNPEEIFSIFIVLAAVLKLGNLTFIPTTNIDGSEGCEISNEYGK